MQYCHIAKIQCNLFQTPSTSPRLSFTSSSQLTVMDQSPHQTAPEHCNHIVRCYRKLYKSTICHISNFDVCYLENRRCKVTTMLRHSKISNDFETPNHCLENLVNLSFVNLSTQYSDLLRSHNLLNFNFEVSRI